MQGFAFRIANRVQGMEIETHKKLSDFPLFASSINDLGFFKHFVFFTSVNTLIIN